MNTTDKLGQFEASTNRQADKDMSRRSPGALDEHYINAYLEHPEAGKTAALRKAGYTGKNISQRASEIHRRLSRQIESALEAKMAESTILGHSVIRRLATESDSETTQLNAAKMLMDYGGRKPTDKLLINDNQRPIEDIDAEIDKVQRRIAEAQGAVN